MGLKNIFIGICVLILLFLFIPIPIDKYTFENPEQQFINFMQQYNKSYSNETVYQKHYRAFLNSMKVVNDLNAKRKHNHSAYYGLTKFSDMTPDEFLDEHLQSDLYQRISERRLDDSNEHDKNYHHKIHPRSLKLNQLPKMVDWRRKGVVTEVNNQKLCGACWAFSVTQNMESMFAIKYGKLRQLSVQQLIDCAGYNNDGCAGGDSCNLLHWLKDYNIPVYNEEDYPLQWQTEKCKKVVNKEGVQINKFACQRLVGNENYILATLANVGPVAVAINALTWQYYLGGVIQFHCGSSFKLLNHAVQIVGYDLTAEIPHYIIRNSWGKDFGKNGYLYIAIGENLCGLANEVSVLSIL